MPPAPTTPEDIVEETEEFKSRQSILSPVSRKGSVVPPLLPPVKPRPFSPADLTALPPMSRGQIEHQQRHHDHPLQRRAQLFVAGATVVVCLIVAAVIVVITQLPGGYPAPMAASKKPAAPVATQSIDLGQLTTAEQKELTQLAREAFGHLPADEDREVNNIYSRINQKKDVTPEQIARFNSLFQKGAGLLTLEQRQRLTALFAKIVRRPAS